METHALMILAMKKLGVYTRNTTVMMVMNVPKISVICKLDAIIKLLFVMTTPALLMTIAVQTLVVTMFLNHLAMTTTHVLMTTVMSPLVNVFLNQFPAMITTHVLMMNVYLTMVAATAMFIAMITMNVLVTLVVLPLVVFMMIFLTNVKQITNVTKIIVILKSDVLTT